ERIFKSSNKLLKEALRINADIYHIHDPELLLLAVKLKKRGKKIIYDSHEDFPQQIKEKTFVPFFLGGFASWITNKFMYVTLQKLDAVISVTPHIVEKLKDKNKNAYLITNYPTVINNEIHFTCQDYMQRKNVLCYAGTVYEFSNQQEILEALNLLPCHIEYKLVGLLSAQYQEILSKCSYWNNVNFIPTLPKSELLKIYQNTTIAVAISDYTPNSGNNLGTLGSNKLFEYMLAGLPIICTDFILWKEFVNRYHCGICVHPRDVNAIKEAIQYLIDHKEEAYQMGQNGQRAVLEEFNWETQAVKYVSIINKLQNSTTN
ncbi:MAG: glycosyltransferase, partial [Bacteroidales bacterium]